jgi:hypothetical protein
MGTKGVIVGGRNDNHKEDDRILTCLESMIEAFDEVWFCDWNSPKDKGPVLWNFKDKLPKTGKLHHVIISEETSKYLTSSIPNISPYAFVLASNLLIRRCTTDWIVSTTIDIIMPKKEPLDDFISKANKNTFYTVSRRDADYLELEKIGFNNWRKYRDELDSKSSPMYWPAKVTPNDNYSLVNCCGDFQLAHRDIWNKVKGFEEQMVYSCFNDTNIQKKAVLNGFNLEAEFDLPIYHLSHTGMGNDGSHPSKQNYNDPWDWVEWFEESQNDDNWGFANIEIEHEII